MSTPPTSASSSIEQFYADQKARMKRFFSAIDIAWQHVNAGGLTNAAGQVWNGENSANIASPAAVNSERFVHASIDQANGAAQGAAGVVFNMLEAAAGASRGAPGGMGQAIIADTQKRIKEYMKGVKEQQEARAIVRAEIGDKKNTDIEAEKVARRLFTAEIASTKSTSDEMKKSKEEATTVYAKSSKDASVNVVA